MSNAAERRTHRGGGSGGQGRGQDEGGLGRPHGRRGQEGRGPRPAEEGPSGGRGRAEGEDQASGGRGQGGRAGARQAGGQGRPAWRRGRHPAEALGSWRTSPRSTSSPGTTDGPWCARATTGPPPSTRPRRRRPGRGGR